MYIPVYTTVHHHAARASVAPVTGFGRPDRTNRRAGRRRSDGTLFGGIALSASCCYLTEWSEEFLQALWELADFRLAGAEGVCLAGAQPGLNVVNDDPEPRAAGGVGAGTVVEAAAEQQDRSGGHLDRDGLGRVGLARRSQVAAGDDAGGAVVGGEVVQCPQRVDHDVAVAGQRVDALFVVEDLRFLAGMDLDGAGETELRARSDHLLNCR